MYLTALKYFTTFWRTYVLFLTPILLIPIIVSGIPSEPNDQDGDFNSTSTEPPDPVEDTYEVMVCAYVVLVMAVYWMTEVLHPSVTALIPVIAFPLLGVLSTNEVAMNYMRGTNFMMLGGLMLAVCVEHSGLHRRIALRIVLLLGTSPKMATFGFMVTTAFTSMFISNAASTAMMVPIVEAFAEVIHENTEKGAFDHHLHTKDTFEKHRNILLLSVAYAASIGGTGVITGNPSNLVVLEILPPIAGVSFATWMAFSLPLAALNLFLAWLWLMQLSRKVDQEAAAKNPAVGMEEIGATESQNNQKKSSKETEKSMEIHRMIKTQYEDLGPMSTHERSILITFSLLILLWFFRKPMFMPGWGDFLSRMTSRGTLSRVSDATPAMLMVLAVFALPAEYKFWPFRSSSSSPESSPALINWETIERRLPWGVLLFVGGGFALSDACTKTGFSGWLVQYLIYLKALPIWLINFIVSTLTAGITEVVSNTATANILMPILKEMSITLCYNPVYLIMSSVVTCCYAFMLPVATAPNAIVFQASSMKTSDMMKAGLPMNIICIITTNIAINTYGSYLFGLSTFPEWAAEEAQSIDGVNCTAVTL